MKDCHGNGQKTESHREQLIGTGSTPVWGSRACPGYRCGCSQLLSWRLLCLDSGASAPRHGLSTGPTPPAGGTDWSPERCCHYEWTAPPGTPAAPAKTNQVRSDGVTAADRTEDDRVLLLVAGWHCGKCALGPSLWASPTHPRTLEAASGNMGHLQPPI